MDNWIQSIVFSRWQRLNISADSHFVIVGIIYCYLMMRDLSVFLLQFMCIRRIVNRHLIDKYTYKLIA